MRKRTLSLLIPLALFTAGAASAQQERVVRVYDQTADGTGAIAVTGVDRDYYDLDADGFADMVVSMRAGLPLDATLDAVADAEWEDVDAMTGSDRKDAAVRMGVATREAAAVASTDRPGERINPALESRALHAQSEGQAQDRDGGRVDVTAHEVMQADAQIVGVALVPVGQRVVPSGMDTSANRLDIDGVVHRTADLDGDGTADLLLTTRKDLEMHAALDAIADADRSQRALSTGSDIKDAAIDAGVATAGAAAAASTDRVGERINPALESRSIHAQTEGTSGEDDELDGD